MVPIAKRLRDSLITALDQLTIDGIEANHRWLKHILAESVFIDNQQTTRWLKEVHYQALAIEVLAPGTQSSIQDWPGREGYWHIGVPPSGPMDELSFRLANRLLGNDEAAAGLEMTMTGPTLQFHHDTAICLSGANMGATLDGVSVPWYQVLQVQAGQTLQIGAAKDGGCRAYLCVAGGFDVPEYLGSQATLTSVNLVVMADEYYEPATCCVFHTLKTCQQK